MDHCVVHDRNTTDIASVKASASTIKWLLSIIIPIGCAVVGYFYTSFDSGITDINRDQKKIYELVMQQNIANARMEEQINNIRRDLEEIKGKKKDVYAVKPTVETNPQHVYSYTE